MVEKSSSFTSHNRFLDTKNSPQQKPIKKLKKRIEKRSSAVSLFLLVITALTGVDVPHAIAETPPGAVKVVAADNSKNSQIITQPIPSRTKGSTKGTTTQKTGPSSTPEPTNASSADKAVDPTAKGAIVKVSPPSPATKKQVTPAVAPKVPNGILFEGYSKVLLGDKHVGYVVQRFEFDAKKKELISSYYLRTGTLAGNVIESHKARCTLGFKPIAWQYNELVGSKTRTIDATFKNDMMIAVIKDGGKTVTHKKSVPKGAFLSSFLVYVMANGKEGIKPGVRYGYLAIAEEGGGIYPGEANIVANEKILGSNGFKIFNTYKDVRFVSYITAKGDVLVTRSPVQNLGTELVATQAEAIAGQSYTPANLQLVFGEIPKGEQNALARRETNPQIPKANSEASKETSKAAPEPAEGASPSQPLNKIGAGDDGNSISEEVIPPAATPGSGEPSADAPSSYEPQYPEKIKGQGIKGGQGVFLKGRPADDPPQNQPPTQQQTPDGQ